MYFALFTTHTQDLATRASTTYFTQQREKSGSYTHCEEGCSQAQASATPGWYSHMFAVQHPAPPPDQISNRAQSHHLNTAAELTNSVPQHRKLSCPWWCAETTALLQNWLVFLHTILQYTLAIEIPWIIDRLAPKWYKWYNLEQSPSTLTLFISNIYILGHISCWHNPYVTSLCLHHFCLFHVWWQITPALDPCKLLEQELKLKVNMLCWLTLASKLPGCFCLHAFLSGREFNTWIFSSVSQKNMDGILKNIQYWPPPEVNATTPGNFSRSGRAKQELWNLTLNPFWDFPRKYWEINQKFPLLSVLTLTLSSLSSTDGGWEVGSTYIRSNTWELF